MSAWFILSALGFYPVDPVSAVYVFGAPLFDAELREVEARLHAAASGAGGATADVSLSSCLIAPVKRLCLYPLMIDAVVDAQEKASRGLQQCTLRTRGSFR